MKALDIDMNNSDSHKGCARARHREEKLAELTEGCRIPTSVQQYLIVKIVKHNLIPTLSKRN